MADAVELCVCTILLPFPTETDADSVARNVVEFSAKIDTDAEERLTFVAPDVVLLLLVVVVVVNDGNKEMVL